MADRNRAIVLELVVDSTNPALLEGLDVWLQLQLLSDREVRALCQKNLTCKLPHSAIAQASSRRLPLNETLEGDFANAVPITPTQPPVRRPPIQLVPRSLQSFMAEISVVWLLFLGVFMVVVSSGVLAATQWQNVAPTGQYGILLLYTLAFFGVSLWAGRQTNLQLTARMLQMTTLLITPVNFWMMDGLNLWQSTLGRGVAAIAALLLTAVQFWLVRPLREEPVGNARLTLINSIGLSWLHWGWGIGGFAWIATYLGTIGTAALLFIQTRQVQTRQVQTRQPIQTQQNGHSTLPTLESARPPLPLSLTRLAIAFATFLLVGRAIVIAQIPVAQLGLALGICGWLLCRLARQSPGQSLWIGLGALLLLSGWAVSVSSEPPWQAIAVSGLALWLLIDRFRRTQAKQDLNAVWVVGLQMFCLLWFLVPAAGRQALLDTSIQWAGNASMPDALLGIGIFPYVVLMLAIATQFRRQQKTDLATHSERLALILGLVLAVLSMGNPLVRSLNLLFSTAALAWVVLRRFSDSEPLVYLTHILGWVAIASWIDVLWPNLSETAWAGVLLIGMVAEWGVSLWGGNLLWRRSAWHLGLGLAGCSYVLLGGALWEPNRWGVVWAIVPLTLTGLAYHPDSVQPRWAGWLSVAALLILQPFTLGLTVPRLIGLGIATGLMLLNTATVRHLVAAVLTVGFGLGLAGAIALEVVDLSAQLTVNLLAIALWSLWLLRDWLHRQGRPLAELYVTATNGWAIAVCSLNLLILTLYSTETYLFGVSWFHVLATGLTIGAIVYRVWQQPTNLGFYGVAWGIEIAFVSTTGLWNGSLEALTIANLALALVTQLAGDWFARERPYRSSWHIIPLIYATLGLGLAHLNFTPYTGLYTLAAALVGIGVGRRQPRLKPLTYLAIATFSLALYELLTYQLLQAEGGQPGDGLVLLAGLAVGIAAAGRLLSRWLSSYLQLGAKELRWIAHLHWLGSVGLSLLAFVSSLSSRGDILWLGLTGAIALYALLSGKTPGSAPDQEAPDQETEASQDAWVYAGIVEAIFAIGYALYRIGPDPSWLWGWAAAIASSIAVILYLAPWSNWGWSMRPWRRSAAILPGAIVALTAWSVALQSLLIVAAFYAWFAGISRQLRFSYLSILLADWAIVRFLILRNWDEPIWLSVVVGGSLLYMAQIDPSLRSPSERNNRHLLRCLAVALICLTAFYQANGNLWLGLAVLGLGLALILLGLWLRVRAFLFVGTATFVIEVLQQTWIFINDYSLLLWAIGIVLGLIFIWIAATFEARRSQVASVMQYWVTSLDEWE